MTEGPQGNDPHDLFALAARHGIPTVAHEAFDHPRLMLTASGNPWFLAVPI